MNKRNWNTYQIVGYSHQVGDDPRATGGVHLRQVRRSRGGWQKRVVDSNGLHKSAGPVTPLDQSEGEALYAQARAQ